MRGERRPNAERVAGLGSNQGFGLAGCEICVWLCVRGCVCEIWVCGCESECVMCERERERERARECVYGPEARQCAGVQLRLWCGVVWCDVGWGGVGWCVCW